METAEPVVVEASQPAVTRVDSKVTLNVEIQTEVRTTSQASTETIDYTLPPAVTTEELKPSNTEADNSKVFQMNDLLLQLSKMDDNERTSLINQIITIHDSKEAATTRNEEAHVTKDEVCTFIKYHSDIIVNS